jgi:hypothetical protein
MTKTKLSIQENEAAEEMAKKIERYIEQYDYVTFAELSNHIAGFSAPANALACEFKLGSVLFWTNMTTPASQAIEKLFVERRICAKNTTALPYFVDGITLRANNWAPLVLRPGRFANAVRLSGIPFFFTPKEMKTVSRIVASEKRRGTPTGFVIESAAASTAKKPSRLKSASVRSAN